MLLGDVHAWYGLLSLSNKKVLNEDRKYNLKLPLRIWECIEALLLLNDFCGGNLNLFLKTFLITEDHNNCFLLQRK